MCLFIYLFLVYPYVHSPNLKKRREIMKSQYRMLFAFVILLLSVSLACYGGFAPTSTQAPATKPPTAPPVAASPEQPQNPSSTTATEAPVQSSGEQFFTEDFNGDISNWSQVIALNNTSGDKSQAKLSVDNGYLVFDLGKELIAYEFYKPFNYKNVRVDVSVDNRGTNVNDILLVCRASEEGLYLVNVANSGLFSFYAFDGTKKTYTRIADGGSNKIKSGKEVNQYSLVCNDKTLTLYINDSEVRSYTDNLFAFREGQVGVGVASEDQVPVKVEFDWVKISQP
jgi:hypothetical protein